MPYQRSRAAEMPGVHTVSLLLVAQRGSDGACALGYCSSFGTGARGTLAETLACPGDAGVLRRFGSTPRRHVAIQ
jgi:hypothetical protein